MNAAKRYRIQDQQSAIAASRTILMSTAENGTTAPSGEELGALVLAIARDRDRQAFATLFQHFAPRVKSYLMRCGSPAGVAEELAQETLLMVWRKAGYFDPGRAAAGTWIFTIARNLRIDQLRQERRRQPVEMDPSDEPEPDASGEALLITAERDERVREALSELSDEQMQMVKLCFFQDRSHSEIARDLGLPLGTVKSRVRRAMMQLRELLAGVS